MYDSTDYKTFGELFTERFQWQNNKLGACDLLFWHIWTHITSTFGEILKDNVRSHNPYSEESLPSNIWNLVCEIPPSQIWFVTNSVFFRYTTCLWVKKNVKSTLFKYGEYST
jgi:hypothetical protein